MLFCSKIIKQLRNKASSTTWLKNNIPELHFYGWLVLNPLDYKMVSVLEAMACSLDTWTSSRFSQRALFRAVDNLPMHEVRTVIVEWPDRLRRFRPFRINSFAICSQKEEKKSKKYSFVLILWPKKLRVLNR